MRREIVLEKLEINTETWPATGLQNKIGWCFLSINILMIL